MTLELYPSTTSSCSRQSCSAEQAVAKALGSIETPSIIPLPSRRSESARAALSAIAAGTIRPARPTSGSGRPVASSCTGGWRSRRARLSAAPVVGSRGRRRRGILRPSHRSTAPGACSMATQRREGRTWWRERSRHEPIDRRGGRKGSPALVEPLVRLVIRVEREALVRVAVRRRPENRRLLADPTARRWLRASRRVAVGTSLPTSAGTTPGARRPRSPRRARLRRHRLRESPSGSPSVLEQSSANRSNAAKRLGTSLSASGQCERTGRTFDAMVASIGARWSPPRRRGRGDVLPTRSGAAARPGTGSPSPATSRPTLRRRRRAADIPSSSRTRRRERGRRRTARAARRSG